MIIDSSDFTGLPGIKQANLSESSDGPGTLTLAWCGYGPEWLRWMEPVTLMHRGRVLFHGRITSFNRTNDAGNMESSCTVQNGLWLLDHMPLGAQVAEAQAANQRMPVDFNKAGREALRSWESLAESCRADAPLWVVDEAGVPQEDGELWLDVSLANYSTGARFKQDKVITAWTALLEMKQANPDATFRMNYTTGGIEVVSIAEAEVIAWDTMDMRLKTCGDIAPQYESCITGVALVVSWPASEENHTRGGSVMMVYPETVNAGDMGVKLYTAQVENQKQASAQSNYMMGQLRRYYEAVNVLQYGGNVTALMDDVTESPLCKRMNVTGTGTHETWHEMAAMVSGVEWDFLEGTVEAQLGAQVGEPDISEMEFMDDEDSSSTMDDGDEPGDDEDNSTYDSTETWGTSTWDNTTTWGESNDGTGTWPVQPSTTADGTGSTTGGEESTTGSHPGGGTGIVPGGSGGSSGSQAGGCDCAEKWVAYEQRMAALEARVTALEAKECRCVEQVQAAIDEALANAPASVGGQGSSTAQTNANGTITVVTTWSY